MLDKRGRTAAIEAAALTDTHGYVYDSVYVRGRDNDDGHDREDDDVEIQWPLTIVAVVAALELVAPIETGYSLAALLHEHMVLTSAGLRRKCRRHQC